MKRVTRPYYLFAIAVAAMSVQAAPAQHRNRGVNARQEHQQERINQGVQSGQITPQEAARLEQQQQALRSQEAQMRASGAGLNQAERDHLEREQNALSRNIRRQSTDGQAVGNPSLNNPAWNGLGYHHHGGHGMMGQTGFDGQPGFPGQAGFPSQAGVLGQPGLPGHTGFSGQPGFAQPGFGQPGMPGTPGYIGQPGGVAGQPGWQNGFNTSGINAQQASQQARIQQGLQSGQLTQHEYQRLEEKQARFAQLESQLRASGGGLSPDERARLQMEQQQLSRDIERQKHDSQVR